MASEWSYRWVDAVLDRWGIFLSRNFLKFSLSKSKHENPFRFGTHQARGGFVQSSEATREVPRALSWYTISPTSGASKASIDGLQRWRSTHLACRRCWSATDSTWHSKDRSRPSRPKTTPVDTKCPASRSLRSAISTYENRSVNSREWRCTEMAWSGYGGRTKVRTRFGNATKCRLTNKCQGQSWEKPKKLAVTLVLIDRVRPALTNPLTSFQFSRSKSCAAER